MRLTIGMAVYKSMETVYFTVQSLRMHHNLKDAEILIIDNYGSEKLKKWCRAWGGTKVRYEKYTEFQGTAVRQQVFEQAKGEFVICIDSHVLLLPGSIDKLWDGDDLIHGPMMYDGLNSAVLCMKDVWRGEMWGIWDDAVPVDKIPVEPFEIWGHGLGLFGSRKDTWLGFNPEFRQFGGEEGYIHEKYRKADRKVLCLPWLRWNHMFGDLMDNQPGYPRSMTHRVKNYLLGFEEIKLNKQPIIDHFGIQMVNSVSKGL